MERVLWNRITDLFDAALERPPAERRAFLESACNDDQELLESTWRLVTEFERAGNFLEGQGPLWRHAFLNGQLICGRYRIEALLGQGGMGEVYRAHDALVDEKVALKTLRPDLAGDPEFLKRFRREIQLARRVTHPSVCRVFDVGVHEEDSTRPVHFFAMQLLEGETLAARIRRDGAFSMDEALLLARQVAAGLDAAHAAGITHGDLKSANVMLSGTLAVIADFGLARFVPTEAGPVQSAHSVAVAHQLAGTVAYMSPEQLQGGPASAASDVYSFGILLFELVTARQPFNETHILRSAMQRVASETPDIRSLAPGLPRSWSTAIARCLNRDPAARYAKAMDAVRDLQPRVPALRGWTRRQWIGGAAGVAAVAGGVALSPAVLRLTEHETQLPKGAEVVLGTIVNLTGDDRLDAVTELFRNQLAQSSMVNVVDGGRISSTLATMGVKDEARNDPVAFREAAWRLNAVMAIYGTVSRIGADLVMNVQLETRGSQPNRPRSRQLKSFSSPDSAALMSSVREASNWIRQSIGESAPSISASDLLPQDATTQSWRALAHFARGQEFFMAQDFNSAIDKFAEALLEDPTFTLAALRRSDLLVSQYRHAEGFAQYRIAMNLLAERAVTRPEELYGRGMFALDSGDFESADRYFRTWAQEYPYDWRAPFYRMLPLCMNGNVEQSLELLEKLQASMPQYGDLYVQIIRARLMVGKTTEARALLPTVARLNRPERADLQDAYIRFREADCVGCLQVLRKVQKSTYRRGMADAMMQEGLLLIDAGYPDAASRNVDMFLQNGSWSDARPQQITLQVVKAWADMLAGRREAAIESARSAMEGEAGPLIIALAGTIFARLGANRLALEALRASEKLKDIIVYQIAGHRIAGELARRAGDSARALTELRKAASLEPVIAHRQYLIEALPPGSDERIRLCLSALRFPWQNLRPPMMHHIGAVGLAVTELSTAGVSQPYADKFLASSRQLGSTL